jgi:hypothetical protein
MLSFMLQEGVITIGTISGIFTALLLNSLKNNIIDPCVEKIAPIHKLINRPVSEIVKDIRDDGKLNNSNNKSNIPQTNKYNEEQKGIFNQFGMNNNHGNQFGGIGKNELKWKLFVRDFVTWLIIMLILYIIWKHILHPIKMKGNINIPSHNTQYFPMGIGKLKK